MPTVSSNCHAASSPLKTKAAPDGRPTAPHDRGKESESPKLSNFVEVKTLISVKVIRETAGFEFQQRLVLLDGDGGGRRWRKADTVLNEAS